MLDQTMSVEVLAETLKDQARINETEIDRLRSLMDNFPGLMSQQDRDVFFMILGQHQIIDQLNEKFDLGIPRLNPEYL